MTTILHRTLVSLRVSRSVGGKLHVGSIDTGEQLIENVFVLPGDPADRVKVIEQLRDDVAGVLESLQAELVDNNLQSLTPEPPAKLVTAGAARRRAEGEAIARDNARENAYFTRTQGWDPRGDGPSLDDEPDVGRPAIGGSDD